MSAPPASPATPAIAASRSPPMSGSRASARTQGFATNNAGLGHPTAINGSTALSTDPFTGYLDGKDVIRVQATQGAAGRLRRADPGDRERTYSLMMSISKASASTAPSATTRALRELGGQHAAARDGLARHPDGARTQRELSRRAADGMAGQSARAGRRRAEAVCATCHQGASKPLLGVSMAKDWPELGGLPAP